MKKLVVATDFSVRADRAVRRAVLLARHSGAAMSLVHVVDDDQPPSLVAAGKSTAGALLDEQARSLRETDGVDCDWRIMLGDPFEGVARAVAEFGPDLLVIGPHRRQVLKDAFVGTTAERTIRLSRTPVVMANGVPAGPYRHVLIATDLSPCSRDAIHAVTTLGLDKGTTVSVIHVYDAPASGLMVRTMSPMDRVRDYFAEEEARAAEALDAFLRGVGFKPGRSILRYNETSVAHALGSAAHELSADLVVVGTRGRTGIAKALLGSVAEQVLRTADRDVLAVPSGGTA